MIKNVEPKEIIDAEFSKKKNKDSYLDIKEDFLHTLREKEGFFIWSPSAARNPRASHMAFYGRTYSYRDGAGDDGILPAEEINCQCGIIELPDNKKTLEGEQVKINPINQILQIAGVSIKAIENIDVKNDKLTAKGYDKYKKAVMTGGGALLARQKAALDLVRYNNKIWKKLTYTKSSIDDVYNIPYELYNPSTKETSTKTYKLSFINNSKNILLDANGLFLSRSLFRDITDQIEDDTGLHVVSLGGL